MTCSNERSLMRSGLVSIRAVWLVLSLGGCASTPPAPLADASLTPAQAQLMQQLRSRDAAERSDAACKVGELQAAGAFAVPVLIKLLSDEKVHFAGMDPNGHAIYDVPAEQAAEALFEIGTAAVDPLMVAARDRRDSVRARAVYALARIADARAIDTLVHALSDRDAAVRLTAVRWFGQKDDRLLDALIKGLNDPDDRVRWAVSKAMHAYVEDPRALQPLIGALSNDSADVQVAAAIALKELGDSPATPVLIRVLDDASSDSSVRGYAALALGSATDEDSFAALLRALDSPDWWPRQGSLQAMKERRDPRAVPRLVASLESENMTERSLAAEALGATGDPRAIEPLKARLSDPQPVVREKVSAALREIEPREQSP